MKGQGEHERTARARFSSEYVLKQFWQFFVDDRVDMDNAIQTKAEFSYASAVMDKIEESFVVRSIIAPVSWVCDVALDDHVWVSELTISCQEAKVLEALQYDLSNPCLVQWVWYGSRHQQVSIGEFELWSDPWEIQWSNEFGFSESFHSALLDNEYSKILFLEINTLCSMERGRRKQKGEVLGTGWVACSSALWWRQWRRSGGRWMNMVKIPEIDDALYL